MLISISAQQVVGELAFSNQLMNTCCEIKLVSPLKKSRPESVTLSVVAYLYHTITLGYRGRQCGFNKKHQSTKAPSLGPQNTLLVEPRSVSVFPNEQMRVDLKRYLDTKIRIRRLQIRCGLSSAGFAYMGTSHEKTPPP